MKVNNSINFQAKLKINLSEEYLNHIENDTMFPDTESQNLRRGLCLLKELAPKIGNDEDTLELTSYKPKANTDKVIKEEIQSTKKLYLSFEDKEGKIVKEIDKNERRLDIGIRNVLIDIFTSITRRYDLLFNFSKVETDENIRAIRKLNQHP